MPQSNISVDALGRITLLQSMAALLPTEIKIMDFTCQGLKELPGIDSVTYTLNDSDESLKENNSSNHENLIISYRNKTLGHFRFSISDKDSYASYLPFLQNFMNMLGVIFEEKRQRRLNEELTRELEARVAERTKQLEERTENLRITLNSIGDGIIVTDVNGKITDLNPVAEKLTGWDCSQALGKPLSEVFNIINNKTRDIIENPVQKVLECGEIVGLANHTLLVNKMGKEYQISDSAAPVREHSGKIIGVVLVFRDVTEEYRIQKVLAESEGKYRRLVEGLGPRYCVFSHTNDGVFLFASGNFKALFGISSADIIGKNWRTLNLTPESIKAGDEADQIVLEKKCFQKVELTSVHDDGSKRIIEVYYGPVIEDGKVVRMEGICADITEHKQTELIVQRSQKLESIGTLAGGIAHDFNNLLGGIFGFMDLASESNKCEIVEKHLSKALNTIDRARGLTNQLITFSKGGAPKKVKTTLLPFIEDTVLFASSGSNVSCKFQIPKNLWICEIDKTQIAQILDNLTINAQQAMPEGGVIDVCAENIVLKENSHSTLAAGTYVRISIKDHGVGISQKCLPLIFDPFYTNKPNGHGLGLATCFSIINQHSGCIDVESKPDEGSLFMVYLPALSDVTHTAQNEKTASHHGNGTMLLMDDEQVILDSVGIMLKRIGYTVCKAKDGEEAMKLFTDDIANKKRISIIILDLTIPGGMGGKETIGAIRELDKDIPVIVASGYAADPIIANPTEYGFTDSICKPFRRSELLDVLEKHVRHD